MSKTLIVVRHAHRDKDQGHAHDNGISDKGKKQAERAAAWLADRLDGEAPLLISSPRLRCVETLASLGDEIGVKVEIRDILDEGARLTERVEEFFRWWIREAPQTVVACSHGDWIPELVHRMTGARIELKKGAIAEISGPSGAPILVNLIQRP